MTAENVGMPTTAHMSPAPVRVTDEPGEHCEAFVPALQYFPESVKLLCPLPKASSDAHISF